MSTTVKTHIKRAMKQLSVLPRGVEPTPQEYLDGLDALKMILRGFIADDIMIYESTIETFNLVSGDIDYSIGSGGDFNTTRPARITSAYLTVGSVDYPLVRIGEDKYNSISQKSAGSYPAWFYYNPSYTTGTLYLYPAPGSGMTITITSLKELSEPANINASTAFPLEYDPFIKFNLAVDLAPEFGVDPSDITLIRAKEHKDNIISYHASMRNEGRVSELSSMGGRNYSGHYNIDLG